MTNQDLIVRLGREFFAAIAGKNPDPLTSAFARVCAQSIMGACKVMEQKSPINLPNLMLNGYSVSELAAMCLRTGLVPGGAGDLCGIYIVPQGSQLRFSISPPGYKELAKARGQVITTRSVPIGCEPELSLDGTIDCLHGPSHKPVADLDTLGGIIVSLNDAHTLAHYASYWVDGATIRAKKSEALSKANGRSTPWTSHPMGMASSKALSIVAKAIGLAGERVSYGRAEILGAQAALTHDQAKTLTPEDRKRVDLPTQSQTATPEAADEQPASQSNTESVYQDASEEAKEAIKTNPAIWDDYRAKWPAFTKMLLDRSSKFMAEKDAAYFLPICVNEGRPSDDWTDDTWRGDADARKAVLAKLAELAEMVKSHRESEAKAR